MMAETANAESAGGHHAVGVAHAAIRRVELAGGRGTTAVEGDGGATKRSLARYESVPFTARAIR